MRVLIVLTSHRRLGDTGIWLEEFVAAYYAFQDAGAEITLASPKGGEPPLDPIDNQSDVQTDLMRRYQADHEARAHLVNTVRLDSVMLNEFDTVFYPGGPGSMWDLAEDQNSIDLIEDYIAGGKTIAFVCHAPGALRHVRNPDGTPFVAGRRVTGFTNREEDGVGLAKIVPFLLENELLDLGAIFCKVKDWNAHTVVDGQLITGQNVASSGPAAFLLIEALRKQGK
jgi:putative intracellular protease/amidase